LKSISYAILIGFAVLMIYASLAVPDRGDLRAEYQQEISRAGTANAAIYYVENAYYDANTPNMVTVILADYRGFDTLGETVVIFTAGVVVALILMGRRKET